MLRFTIVESLLLIAAFGVGLAAMKGDYLWFNGMSLFTILGLLIAAVGASPGRPTS
jgi:hypothetical protein